MRDSRSARPTFWQRTGRIFTELLGGAVGVGVSFGAGWAMGCGLDHGRCRGENFALSGFTLGIFGLPAGVTLAGELMGARGGYGWSVLGELGGAVVALPLALLFQRRPGLAAAAAVVLPVAGAVVGFEVSSESAMARRPRELSSRPTTRWLPALSLAPDGVMVGAVGVF